MNNGILEFRTNRKIKRHPKRNSKKPFRFIVIGGWAAYLWTKNHKSKDIDIIIPDFKDLAYLKDNYDLRKNDNLKRYEIKFGEIDLDIYIPYYSKLTLPIEDIKNETTKIENIEVVNPEILLILKQGAEIEREKSAKGLKDRIDIMTLILFSEVNFEKYLKKLEKYNLIHFVVRLEKIVSNFREIKYLELNAREFKLKKEKILENLKKTKRNL